MRDVLLLLFCGYLTILYLDHPQSSLMGAPGEISDLPSFRALGRVLGARQQCIAPGECDRLEPVLRCCLGSSADSLTRCDFCRTYSQHNTHICANRSGACI